MVFDGVTSKSPVQTAVEAMLAQPGSRTDVRSRRERTIAAMILECADKGYGDAKIVNIAKRAKVSTASVYRDFVDRDGLLMAALQTAVPLFGSNWLVVTEQTDPFKRVEALLLAHGRALDDPFMGWIFRLYVHLAHTKAPQMLAMARLARDANLATWMSEIAKMQADGHLVATDNHVIVAIILGAIERRTIFARMAFGENDDNAPDFVAVARHAALALFQVYGSAAFWASRTDKPTHFGCVKDVATPHVALPTVPNPKALMELPSRRLAEFASRLLRQDVDRLDARARRTRVQLAAMLECIDYGYEAATMASVAHRAGVSTATLYLDYKDKAALFLDAIILQSRFRVDYQSLINANEPMEASIVSLVYSLSYVLADPNFLWFHRVSMASEISAAPELIASSRQTRAYTETFWRNYMRRLQALGEIQECDLPLTVNLLLGATQRRSILSMVFFGIEDVSFTEIATLARASTEFVLRLIASPTNSQTQ